MKPDMQPAELSPQPSHRGGGPRPSPLQDRWGHGIDPGFVAIPSVLVTQFAALKITPTEFLILVNLVEHWREADRGPFPRVSTIAKRLGASPRTVQRGLNQLRSLKLIDWKRVQVRDGKVIDPGRPGEGVRRRIYDLSPLVERAGQFAARRRELQAPRTDGGVPIRIAA